MRLYVGNLDREVTEADLAELFGTAGAVVEAKLYMDRNHGQSRGFGFVTMGSAAEGERAMERFNGHVLKGRPLAVNEARAAKPDL